MKRGDAVIRNGLRYIVVRVEYDGPREYPSLVLEGSPAHAINFPPAPKKPTASRPQGLTG